MGICFCCKNSYNVRPTTEAESSLSRLVSMRQQSKNLYTVYKLIEILSSSMKRTLREVEGRRPDLNRKFVIESINKQDFRGKTDRLLQETEFLLSLDHPAIVDFFEIHEDVRSYHIVSELCTGGSLEEFIQKTSLLTESIIAKLTIRILKCILYLHSKGFVHGYLTNKSFLFTESGLKLAKFDIVKRIDKEKLPLHLSCRKSGNYSEEDDAWSVGVILYFMLSAEYPFNHSTDLDKKTDLNFTGNRWDLVSKEAKHLISQLLERDTKKRLSLKDALSHPWFNRVKHTQPEISVHVIKNLLKVNFKECNFWAFMLRHFIKYLVDHKIKELAESFLSIDSDGTGAITPHKLLGHLNTPFFKNETMKKGIQETITFSDFVRASCTDHELFSEELIRRSFSYLDIKGNNHIVGFEVFEIFQRKRAKFSDDEILNMLDQAKIDLYTEIKFEKYYQLILDIKESPYRTSTNEIRNYYSIY